MIIKKSQRSHFYKGIHEGLCPKKPNVSNVFFSPVENGEWMVGKDPFDLWISPPPKKKKTFLYYLLGDIFVTLRRALSTAIIIRFIASPKKKLPKKHPYNPSSAPFMTCIAHTKFITNTCPSGLPQKKNPQNPRACFFFSVAAFASERWGRGNVHDSPIFLIIRRAAAPMKWEQLPAPSLSFDVLFVNMSSSNIRVYII